MYLIIIAWFEVLVFLGFFWQFDFPFVDVYRVKCFQFTSKLSEDNESNVMDIGKKRFGQFCRDHPACCCNIVNSTWNCDGETLDSSAIEVR